MAEKVFKQAIVASVIIDVLKNSFGKLVSTAAENGGKAAGKAIEDIFAPKPRALFDSIIDHLNEIEGITSKEAEKAIGNWKRRLSQAAKDGKENRTITAACKILSLDSEKESGNYEDYPIAAARIAELGLMDDDDFWQSIEFLTDDPLREFFSHRFGDRYVEVKNTLIRIGEKAKMETVYIVDTVFKKVGSVYNSSTETIKTRTERRREELELKKAARGKWPKFWGRKKRVVKLKEERRQAKTTQVGNIPPANPNIEEADFDIIDKTEGNI